MSHEEKLKGAKKIVSNIISLSPAEKQNFELLAYNGIEYGLAHASASFPSYVQSLELDQKDKDLIKGVFYGWIRDNNEYVAAVSGKP